MSKIKPVINSIQSEASNQSLKRINTSKICKPNEFNTNDCQHIDLTQEEENYESINQIN